ncbi:hypothetical protein KSP40_PGU018376 [Platanthera guangdongensis]|uniref:Uncharacterized protein n=1 Tax=Platanthera guangdongensis TaxID=2320717 RepID=A0ABR2LT88_9ASPA
MDGGNDRHETSERGFFSNLAHGLGAGGYPYPQPYPSQGYPTAPPAAYPPPGYPSAPAAYPQDYYPSAPGAYPPPHGYPTHGYPPYSYPPLGHHPHGAYPPAGYPSPSAHGMHFQFQMFFRRPSLSLSASTIAPVRAVSQDAVAEYEKHLSFGSQRPLALGQLVFRRLPPMLMMRDHQ